MGLLVLLTNLGVYRILVIHMISLTSSCLESLLTRLLNIHLSRVTSALTSSLHFLLMLLNYLEAFEIGISFNHINLKLDTAVAEVFDSLWACILYRFDNFG